MKLKSKNKNFFIYLSLFILLIFCLFFLTISKKDLIKQIHATNESIISMDLGYSSLFNIINDGSEKYLGDFNQSIISKLKNLILNSTNVLFYKIKSINKKNFDKIFIDINFKNYQMLLNDRNIALDKGNAINIKFQEVNSDIWQNGKRYKAKVRLKGILNTHWFNERRMSLKIRLLNNETIMGFNEFSIQKPRERQWPFNSAYEQFSNTNGVLSSNSDLLKVIVNGKNWGIMLAEQSLGKVYLENNNKKESLIFKFGKEEIWYEGWSTNPYFLYRLGDPTLNFRVYNINKILNSESIEQNLHNRRVISYVLNKFEDYDENLFDKYKMATAFFSSLVWGQFHNLLNNNTSYYFNPYLLKLEPIVRDQYSFEKFNTKNEIQQWPPPIQFLQSLKISDNEKNNILKEIYQSIKIVENEFLKAKKFFPVDALKTTSILNQNINTIKKNNDEFINFDSTEFYKRLNNNIVLDYYQLRQFQDMQKPYSHNENQKKRINQILHFNHYENGDIKIHNLLTETIIINKIIYQNQNIISKKISIPGYLDGSGPIIINTNLKGLMDNSITIESEFENKFYSNTNYLTLFKNVRNPLLYENIIPNFIKIKNNDFYIKSGEYIVEQDIMINGQLNIEEGVRLKFNKDTSLIIRGSLIAEGSQDNKIVFESAKDTWDGVFVFNSEKSSKLSNLIFKNMNGITESILDLTGSINFYNADVELSNIEFINNYSEDALNIIESNFEITDSKFINIFSDAFDSDYSNGKMDNIFLNNIGGDGLDFSGSNVNLNNINALNVRDKAISIGENSNLNIYDLNFEKIGVAVAVKDGSYSKVQKCYIKNAQLFSFMTYIKKKMYTFPELKIENCNSYKDENNNLIEIVDPNIKYFRQIGTIMSDKNKQNIIEKKLNVDELYKNTIMRK